MGGFEYITNAVSEEELNSYISYSNQLYTESTGASLYFIFRCKAKLTTHIRTQYERYETSSWEIYLKLIGK